MSNAPATSFSTSGRSFSAAEMKNEADFDYRFIFVIYGAVGLIRAWVNRNCEESAVQMAELADALIRRGSLT